MNNNEIPQRWQPATKKTLELLNQDLPPEARISLCNLGCADAVIYPPEIVIQKDTTRRVPLDKRQQVTAFLQDLESDFKKAGDSRGLNDLRVLRLQAASDPDTFFERNLEPIVEYRSLLGAARYRRP